MGFCRWAELLARIPPFTFVGLFSLSLSLARIPRPTNPRRGEKRKKKKKLSTPRSRKQTHRRFPTASLFSCWKHGNFFFGGGAAGLRSLKNFAGRSRLASRKQCGKRRRIEFSSVPLSAGRYIVSFFVFFSHDSYRFYPKKQQVEEREKSRALRHICMFLQSVSHCLLI